MYSVLLTAMMATGTTAPEFGGLFNRGCQGCQGCAGCFGCGGCYGCGGCCGGWYGGCTGFSGSRYGCGGCQGCGGCCGGGFLGLGLFTSRHGCGGCCGGCFGCAGCYGSCFGSCYGGCFGMPIEYSVGYGMDPVSVGMPGPGMAILPGGMMMPPAAPAVGETLQPAPTPPMPPAGTGEAITSANQATVVVTLPADAKLFADGQLIEQAGPVRSFRTPALEPGKSYFYMISMEVLRNGKVQKAEERVALEAGKVSRVNFPEPAPASGNTARLRIGVPQGATLTVEGQSVETPNGVAVIRTPEIPAGQEHVYQLKIELTRQGKPLTMNRDVSFKAGQEIRIIFDEPTTRLTSR